MSGEQKNRGDDYDDEANRRNGQQDTLSTLPGNLLTLPQLFHCRIKQVDWEIKLLQDLIDLVAVESARLLILALLRETREFGYYLSELNLIEPGF
ncbi:MAG: hypothetical protein DMF61_23195 [Blastocatellia bacterium AA13]|nr:MAG: hypothetical protein DMF61_23195 [Blastocatellia bacterium AA13]